MSHQKVLVVGGTGYFGRLLVEDLIRFVDCDLVVASRRPFRSKRYETVVADLLDPASLKKALCGVDVAICAAGPFQELPATLVELCLLHNIHYIDLADDRRFVLKVRELAAGKRDSRSSVCTGWSTVSALSGWLAGFGAEGLNSIESIYIHMAPGNRGARQAGTIASLMYSVGQPLNIFRRGRWQHVVGWSDPRDFVFPPPIGLRRGYVVDVADHELLPQFLSAKTVEFRAGSELMSLNRCLSILRWLSEKRLVRDWVGWSHMLQSGASLMSKIGHDCGALGVEVNGPPIRRLFILAEATGERMAVMPASVMTSLLLSRTQAGGLISPLGWLTHDQLSAECRKRGFQLIVEVP